MGRLAPSILPGISQLAREVAVKLLRRAPPAVVESAVMEEGRLLARVRHPNVVTVYGADTRDGVVGLWMEFISGRTLSEIVRSQGVFGPREATLIAVDVCRALAAVHAAGLVHGDIKAQNVMREAGGRIVLMDFGAGTRSRRLSPTSMSQRRSGHRCTWRPRSTRANHHRSAATSTASAC